MPRGLASSLRYEVDASPKFVGEAEILVVKQRSGRRLGFVEALPNTDDGCVLVSYTAS